MIVRGACPACGSTHFKKNGHTHHGTQPHQCKTCPRQFVQGSGHYRISEETRALMERLLVERSSLRGIGRAVGVGLKWLLGVLVQGLEARPDHLHVEPVPCTPNVLMQRLEVEADDMSSVVQKKANKQWICSAMDATTRRVMACSIGDRRRRRAKCLGAKTPQVYRQHATFDTDQDVVYEGLIPAAQHKAIRKLARKPNHLKRFNNTLRQRGSRLVRET